MALRISLLRKELEAVSLDGQTLARSIGELERGRSRVRDNAGKGVGQSVTDGSRSLIDFLCLFGVVGVLHVHGVGAPNRISQDLISNRAGSDNHRDCLGHRTSSNRRVNEHIDTCLQRHGGGIRAVLCSNRVAQRNISSASQTAFALQSIGKLTSCRRRSPWANIRNIQLAGIQGCGQMVHLRIRSIHTGSLQRGVNGSLIVRIRHHTISNVLAGTILNIIANLVCFQVGVGQLFSGFSGERERCYARYRSTSSVIGLCAGCAQGHATQQRRRGGDAGEKFPHLHENPLFLIV